MKAACRDPNNQNLGTEKSVTKPYTWPTDPTQILLKPTFLGGMRFKTEPNSLLQICPMRGCILQNPLLIDLWQWQWWPSDPKSPKEVVSLSPYLEEFGQNQIKWSNFELESKYLLKSIFKILFHNIMIFFNKLKIIIHKFFFLHFFKYRKCQIIKE